MSGLRRRGFTSPTFTTKTLIGIFALLLVGSICTLLKFPRALAATIVSDDFNDNSINTSVWNPNDVFSGFTNTNVPIAETSQQIEMVHCCKMSPARAIAVCARSIRMISPVLTPMWN